tara:strand:+ start:1325 stop:1444 length:120 start_codon:yes stop_codon:yes gene_type:complete
MAKITGINGGNRRKKRRGVHSKNESRIERKKPYRGQGRI